MPQGDGMTLVCISTELLTFCIPVQHAELVPLCGEEEQILFFSLQGHTS